MSTLVQVITLIEDLISKIETIGFGSDTDEVVHNGITRASVAKSIKDRYAAIQAAVQGRKSFETLTDLNNYTPTADGDGQYPLAEVWKDTTALNNGLYGWDGSAWVKSEYDIPTKIEEINTLFAQASAEVDEVKTRIDNSEEKRGSIRFYQRNGWNDYDADSGHIWQSKENMPWFHKRGTTTLIRASIPWGVMCNNREFQLMGSGNGSAGNTFMYQLFGTDHNNSANDGKLQLKMNIGSGGGYTLTLDAMPNTPNDILVVHSTDASGNVSLAILNGETATVESIATTTTTSVDGCPFRGAGFAIGASTELDEDITAIGAPASKWCGNIAEVVLVNEVITPTEAASLVGGIYENLLDVSLVSFARDFSKIDYLKPFAENDTSSASVRKGLVSPGPSVGMSDGLYVVKKQAGYIAGIQPGSKSASVKFDVTTDGELSGQLLARVVSNGIALTGYHRVALLESGTSSYIALINIPINSDWCGVEFKCGDAEFLATDPIASGLKFSLTGQSQVAYLRQYDELAEVVHEAKYPASICYHNKDAGGYPGASLFIIDHNPISDGVAGFVHHCNQNAPVPVCYVSNEEPGTGVDQLCDDSKLSRKWAWLENIVNLSGADVSAHIYNWGTNNLGTTTAFGDQILTPLVEGITTEDGGVDGAGVPIIDHYLYDGNTFNRNAAFVLSPLTGHRDTNAGPFDFDNSYGGNVGLVRESQLDWAKDRNIPIGPFVNDLPTGGPHQYSDTSKGNWRFGIRMAEAGLRAVGISMRKNPEIESFKWVNGSRNQIDVRVKLPNRGALQTDGGDPKWGFEFDDGSGRTRLGFSAQIINPLTVRLTKDSGDWSDSVVWYYQFGGPLGYGTSISEYETCAGQLYDGVGMDGTVPGDNLGTPVASSQNSYSVS